MITLKNIILVLVLIAIIGSIAYFESTKPRIPHNSSTSLEPGIAKENQMNDRKDIQSEKAKKYSRAAELAAPNGFINTSAFKLADIVGKKVILVDFWTYSCINCQRTLPYLTSWYQKYKEGLEIVGIHSPEFDFEKKYENVKAAVQKFGIAYPVVLDSDYGTWNAYENRYWPHKYLIDIDGFIVYDHIGEGSYDETERKIQELLQERSAALKLGAHVAADIVHPSSSTGMDLGKIQSPETYFGSARNTLLGNGTADGDQVFALPADFVPNTLYLGGAWSFSKEFTQNRSSEARIVYRYMAKDVYFVASSDNGVTIKVLRDGKPLESEAGEDVIKNQSSVRVREDRLYKLIQDPKGYGEHTLELIIESPGVRAFTFTFG